MILFIYGEDVYRSHAKLAALKQRYIDASLGDTNLAVIDDATVEFDLLVRQIQALPFLAPKRLVVVKNLLLNGKKDIWEKAVDYLPKIPDSTVVVFYEAGRPDARTRLFKALAKPKISEEFKLLIGQDLTNWLSLKAETLNVKFTPTSLNLFIESVGSDLWRAQTELEKLAAYAEAEGLIEIDISHIKELIHTEKTSDVFRLIEAIAAENGARALDELQILLRSGEAEIYLLAMISYQFRTLIVLAEALSGGDVPPWKLAKTLGMSPFVIQKNLELAKKQPLPTLTARYSRLFDYDLAIKTGTLEPKIGLELLVTEFSLPPRSTTPAPVV